MIGIIAEPRSGSTTLYKILTEYHRFDLAFEPFNRLKLYKCLQIDGPYYDSNNILDAVKNIETRYDGLKTLVHHLSVEKNQYLISRFKSIYLYRKNTFEATISYCLARLTSIWDNKAINDNLSLVIPNDFYCSILNNIYIHNYQNRTKYNDCLLISYEEIYQSSEGYYKICDYFDIKPIDDAIINNLKNSGRYSLKNKISITNLSEIKQIFIDKFKH